MVECRNMRLNWCNYIASELVKVISNEDHKTISEITYNVSGGALNSTPTELEYG